MRTLIQIMRDRDYLRDYLKDGDMMDANAMAGWPETERIEFDVNREKARLQLEMVEHEYHAAITSAARSDQ